LNAVEHDNIVPFIGIARVSDQWDSASELPSEWIVSAWMPHGSLRSYIEKHPHSSRGSFVIDIAQGLNYLHSREPAIVHGNLKADNVLIDGNGVARLCDFGLNWILEDTDLWNTSAASAQGKVWWTAPELLEGKQQRATRKSDMYAYGMTCYETYADQLPFGHLGSEYMAMKAVTEGKVPQRPPSNKNVSDPLWDLWMECWRRSPESRPPSNRVHTRLQELLSLEQL